MHHRLLFLLLFVTTFSWAADPRDSDSPYGVLTFLHWNHDWNNYLYDTPEKIHMAVTLMKEAGVGFARMDFLWGDLEPEKGTFDFKHQDELVDALTQSGIRVLGILEYNPSWSGGEWNAPPDRDLYVRYARAVVRHYKDRVKYWEIWNEPDERTYWDPQDEMKAYTELLKAAYPAIKEEDPTSQVLLGGLTDKAPFALRRVYQHGGAGSFDIVNFHPFINPVLPDAVSRVHGIYISTRRVMEENGDGEMPIWFTELGCPGLADLSKAKGWWGGKTPTEEEQAQWVADIYGTMLQWKGVQKIFWAFFQDTGSKFGNDVDSFGLVRGDFSKKPAYEAYQKAATAVR